MNNEVKFNYEINMFGINSQILYTSLLLLFVLITNTSSFSYLENYHNKNQAFDVLIHSVTKA